MEKTVITQMNNSKPLLPSRFLKFRAWVRNEIMVDVVSIDFNNEFITWYDNQYDRCVPPNKCYEVEAFDDIVLMQFTGLKDKNGIEIFECDIVKADWHWEDGKIVDLSYEGYFFYTISEYALEDVLEVIGNIFENYD